MLSCNGCGEENLDKARVCIACDEPSQEQSAERFCRVVIGGR